MGYSPPPKDGYWTTRHIIEWVALVVILLLIAFVVQATIHGRRLAPSDGSSLAAPTLPPGKTLAPSVNREPLPQNLTFAGPTNGTLTSAEQHGPATCFSEEPAISGCVEATCGTVVIDESSSPPKLEFVSGELRGAVGDENGAFQITITGYTGPGIYTAPPDTDPPTTSTKGTADVEFVYPSLSRTLTHGKNDTVTVNADGKSGSMHLTETLDPEVPGDIPLVVTGTWRCA